MNMRSYIAIAGDEAGKVALKAEVLNRDQMDVASGQKLYIFETKPLDVATPI